jgi:hypothetical protein
VVDGKQGPNLVREGANRARSVTIESGMHQVGRGDCKNWLSIEPIKKAFLYSQRDRTQDSEEQPNIMPFPSRSTALGDSALTGMKQQGIGGANTDLIARHSCNVYSVLYEEKCNDLSGSRFARKE